MKVNLRWVKFSLFSESQSGGEKNRNSCRTSYWEDAEGNFEV